jgi:lysozyme family protein
MSDARTAILITLDLAHEGGFQKNPKDRANWTGGQVGVGTLVGTNGGITALDMPGVDIEHLTLEQKIEYYTEHYWKPLYSQIDAQGIANKLFDLGVLFGVGTAVKNLQAALDLNMDGIFGPITLAKLNAANDVILLSTFQYEMILHARAIAAANPNEAPICRTGSDESNRNKTFHFMIRSTDLSQSAGDKTST